jgi:lysophospholipase L1-like esterase
MLHLNREHRWVFIGDSITDCGRRDDPDQLGGGYVRLIRDWLVARSPEQAPQIINRGVGGDRVLELQKRWQEDVIALHPHVLSIKIGINDVWRQLNPASAASGVLIDQYLATYEKLLSETISADPEVRIVLCEPSVISPPQPEEGNQKLRPYVHAVRSLAGKFGDHVVHVVGLHEACLAAQKSRPDIVWWPDGVHPTSAGHMLLARTWLGETGLL